MPKDFAGQPRPRAAVRRPAGLSDRFALRLVERLIILLVKGAFYNAYFVFYLVWPRLARAPVTP
jgi:hypothetical protein